MTGVRQAPLAKALYDTAVEHAPQIAFHHRIPGSLHSFEGIDAIHALLARAVAVDSSFAAAHAALGNTWIRLGQTERALSAYRTAVAIDPAFAEAHLALAELLYEVGEYRESERHLQEALSRRFLYSHVAAVARRSILMLCAPKPWSFNVPLDFVLDESTNAIHRLYLTEDDLPLERLPTYDLVFNAIGEAEGSRGAIERAQRFIAAQSKPAINLPSRLPPTARPALKPALHGIAGCTVPATVRLGRDEPSALGGLRLPLLIRPVDSHGGRELELLRSPDDLDRYLAHTDRSEFDLSEFIEYHDPDGFYRKYRVMFVAGEPFAYHLAISPEWMVHYYKAPMREHAWMRTEEECFLAEPSAVFPGWKQTFPAIGRAIGLDYFGIDCARAPDGSVTVFEADAAMLVHCLDPVELFPYKHRLVPRIFAALAHMLDDRIRAGK